jgi:hypothetical protein
MQAKSILEKSRMWEIYGELWSFLVIELQLFN